MNELSMSNDSCNKCEHLRQPVNQYMCEITCSNIENINERPSWCPLKKNCHNYCRYGKMCRYVKGCDGMNPDDCAMYYKLDDLMNEARDMEQEQRKSLDDYYEDWE